MNTRTKQFALLLACVWLGAVTAPAEDAELLERGEKIYRAQCADCHGDRGQGVESAYEKPLLGDASAGELTKLIADTMPEEDAESCVGEEAAAVAYYVHYAFYSPAAQLRNRPPRIQLSRLTGDQLRQSVADLYGHFQNQPWIEKNHGIRGVYFDGSRWKKENIKIERTDPVLEFDFGTESPGEGINKEEFYIEWTGALKVDHSGRHELVLRTSCSSMMYFGHRDRELVNNHVQSEGKTEFRRTMMLTAGRAYPIRIEFRQRKRKTKQPPASISLSWVPPGGVEEIIPQRNLLAASMPATFSLQSKLPPDDRSYGYDRGTSVDRGWDDSTTNAAIEFAQIAIDELYPDYRRRHRKDADENRAKLRGFLQEVIQTAFRGPIDDATRTLYLDSQLDAAEDDAEAIKRVCLLTLKSPRFLYPALDLERTKSQRVANRLALALHDSLPADAWLIDAIEQDRLNSDQQINEAAERMVNDYRTQAKVRSFLYQWFDLADTDEISKDAEAFPNFDPALVSDLRKSFDAMLDEIVWSETSDFRQLFQADWSFTNDRIAAFYGDRWQPAEGDGPALSRTVGDAEARIGALGHPLVMSNLAYHDTSSPIHRGVFLIRHAFGRTLRPPNEAFTPIDPDLHPDLTTRQRVELQTGEVNCQVCHEKINSLGFALENFDAVGRFRKQERGQPIDPTGTYTTRQGKDVTINGPRDLANFLAASEDSQQAFVESAFEYFVKQPVAAFGVDTIDRLTTEFRESGFNIRQLLVAIAVTAAQQPSSESSS
jgi:mono/diheme cytochrome c family protein